MKKPKKIIVADEIVMNKIYYIRNQKVMLDRDLAELYGVPAIRLREQVKRNAGRFPRKFMFRLTKKETKIMVSQNAIPSRKYFGGSLPYAFTEHGVLMLASVLKSRKAMRVSIRVIEIFVRMREMLSPQKDILLELEKIEKKVSSSNGDIKLIFKYLRQLLNAPGEPRRKISFQILDGN